jgi:archaemetzincin
MSHNDFSIGILPVGEIDPLHLKIVAGSFLGEFRMKFLILPPLGQPEYAFDKRRIQYNAGTIITNLEAIQYKGCNKIIALVDTDLFIPVFSFVLGEARMGGTYALVSIFRLQKDPVRTVKVALHEFGHLMDINHCQDQSCVMKFSKNIKQLDSNSGIFCRYCIDQIKYKMRQKP